jgi:hypothetical protein
LPEITACGRPMFKRLLCANGLDCIDVLAI